MPFDELGIYLWPCITAILAGIINSLAGGGTLLTFPSLIAALEVLKFENPEAMANATSTIALMPAALSSAWAYRLELAAVRRWLRLLLFPSLLGGTLGATLVIWQPEAFGHAVPWLILSASLLFTAQPLVARWLGHMPTGTPSGRRLAAVVVAQFIVAVYGGYFGAGIGILMLSALGLMGMSNLHEMNALKVVLAASINIMAVLVFLIQDRFADTPSEQIVHWPLALTMMGAAIIGGYVGARYGRQVPAKYVRYFVITVGFALTAWYFYDAYAGQEEDARSEMRGAINSRSRPALCRADAAPETPGADANHTGFPQPRVLLQ